MKIKIFKSHPEEPFNPYFKKIYLNNFPTALLTEICSAAAALKNATLTCLSHSFYNLFSQLSSCSINITRITCLLWDESASLIPADRYYYSQVV